MSNIVIILAMISAAMLVGIGAAVRIVFFFIQAQRLLDRQLAERRAQIRDAARRGRP